MRRRAYVIEKTLLPIVPPPTPPTGCMTRMIRRLRDYYKLNSTAVIRLDLTASSKLGGDAKPTAILSRLTPDDPSGLKESPPAEGGALEAPTEDPTESDVVGENLSTIAVIYTRE